MSPCLAEYLYFIIILVMICWSMIFVTLHHGSALKLTSYLSIQQRLNSGATIMPVNTWNFYRAVSVGSDHASWLSQNPQVEDGRIGGNKEFDQDVRDQYQYEVA